MIVIVVGVVCLFCGTLFGLTVASMLNAAHERGREPANAPSLGDTVEWRGERYEVKQLYFNEEGKKIAKILGGDFTVAHVPVNELKVAKL